MTKKNTDSIAYIYNEMDPAEEVEFERKIRDNENILIEVESLKSLKEKLNQLPLLSPPEDVVDSICKAASDGKTKKNRFPIYSTVAAVLVVGLTSGFLLLGENGSNDNNRGINQAAIGSTSSLQQQSISNSDNIDLKPWVDRNEVLHFSDRVLNPDNPTFDTVFKNSYQKLTPVSDPIQSRRYQQNLHLTGNSNQ